MSSELSSLYLYPSPGTCDQGQLTGGGLKDSIQHGKDFWSVYGSKGSNPLLDNVSEEVIYVRTSPEERTLQVAGGLLRGMGYSNDEPFKVHTSPATIVSSQYVSAGGV